MTLLLAREFARVEACDISQEMLDYAKARLQQLPVGFHLSKGSTLPLASGSVTGVFSTFVFQHFDSLAHGKAMFAEAARVLAPGGTLLIQLPVHSFPFGRPGLSILHGLRERAEWAHAAVRRRLPLQPTMRGLSYPAHWFFQVLPALGLRDVELAWFCAPQRPESPMSAVLARRA